MCFGRLPRVLLHLVFDYVDLDLYLQLTLLQTKVLKHYGLEWIKSNDLLTVPKCIARMPVEDLEELLSLYKTARLLSQKKGEGHSVGSILRDASFDLTYKKAIVAYTQTRDDNCRRSPNGRPISRKIVCGP